MSQEETLCLCQSRKKYKECCLPFITGEGLPKTPEELMRSRYAAYNLGKFDYIKKTSYKEALLLVNANPDQHKLDGVRLDIITASEEGETGHVEFKAYYQKEGRISYIHEKSEFEKVKGTWLYVKVTLVYTF